MNENVICPAEDYTIRFKSIVFGWSYDVFAHMSSQRLYLNSLLYLVYIFQIIKYNIADAHSAGTKSELMNLGTVSLKNREPLNAKNSYLGKSGPKMYFEKVA